MKPFMILTTAQLLAILDKYSYEQLHIHHTWKPNHSNFNGKNHLALQEGMYNHHTKTNGWSDIGQHVTLMPDGSWVTGRDFGRSPASINQWNDGAFAVEMLGDFDKGKDKLEGKQKESILDLTRYFVGRLGLDGIKFHRDGPGVTKTCPGSGIDKAQFMKEVESMDRRYNTLEEVPGWAKPLVSKLIEKGYLSGGTDGKLDLSMDMIRMLAILDRTGVFN